MEQIPILSVIGKSDTGKTTLLEKLVKELKHRGYQLAIVKHHAHAGSEFDQPGKDTWRFARAGCNQVILAAPDQIVSIRRLEHEMALDEIIDNLDGIDLILTEGFKNAGKPALEVLRADSGLELIGDLEQLVAIATDTPLQIHVPQFSPDDIQGISDFIEDTFLAGPEYGA